MPALLTWRRSGDDELAALAGTLSAQVVDALQGAPELLAFGADGAALDAVEALGTRADALERRHARLAAGRGAARRRSASPPPSPPCSRSAWPPCTRTTWARSWWRCSRWPSLATFETVPGVPLAVARSLSVRAAADRLFALEDVPVPVRDPAAPVPAAPGVPEVAFEDAALRYGPGLPRALDGVTLRLPPGGRVAVTGSSGAGKSSLVTALLRYWPLEGGTLSLGGTDVERLPQPDARAACALADQRAQMFAGTVRSNLVLGRPDASEDEIAAALRAARLDAVGGRAAGGARHARSARTASPSRAASAAASPWPAPCSPPGPSSSSTSRPAGSTPSWPTSSWTGVLGAAGGAERAA